MWVESVLLSDDQILDATELDGWTLTAGAVGETQPRMLLAHVIVTEDQAGVAAYSGLILLALAGDSVSRAGTIDLTQPVRSLWPAEQLLLHEWLISCRWSAWARASLGVRAMLGVTEPPIALAEAARQWMLPLATLSGAAVAERLPTIQAGDRHLVYHATIGEAQQRGLLRAQRGRPRRR